MADKINYTQQDYNELINSLTQKHLMQLLANRWKDPAAKMEDVFNIRKADGSLVSMKLPEPHKKIIREGILGKARKKIKKGEQHLTFIDKGRQIGFSCLVAGEMVLIAEEYPNTNQYYMATRAEQVEDWLSKLNQLIVDANHLPEELGGGPILHIRNIHKVMEKNINNCKIIGLSANPAGARGHTGINYAIDEMAHQIKQRNQAKENWAAMRYYIRQGGQGRILSTPRTSDDQFMTMYTHPNRYGATSYYCPVITNVNDIDMNEPFIIYYDNDVRKKRGFSQLSKVEIDKLIEQYRDKKNFIIDNENKIIKQKLDIPYWWVSIDDLEYDRSSDLELFKQENMGMAVDETYKLYKSEWIYDNISKDGEWDDRGDSSNPFYILIDFARKKDLTAITVVEKVREDLYYERRIEESQEKYPQQVEQIMRLYNAFKPIEIRIDDTGAGIPIGDMIEKTLRDRGKPTSVLTRITFTSSVKEDMALSFRNLIQNGMYKFLNENDIHARAIRHVLKVEKVVTEVTTRYSGKMHGRDDHWCSKMQIAYKSSKMISASLGKVRRIISPEIVEKKLPIGEQLLQRQDIKKEEIDESKENNIKKIIEILDTGAIHCSKNNKIITPLFCTSCDNRSCPHYRYMYKICFQKHIRPEEVFKHQQTHNREGTKNK